MKRVWLVAVLAIFAVSLGCGGGGPKASVEKVFEAEKTGDVDTAIKYTDLQGLYDLEKKMHDAMAGMAGEMGAEAEAMPSFEEWKKDFIAEEKKKAKPNKEFEYEIVDVQQEGDTATVKVKTKDKKDADWKDDTLTLKKIGGTWKISMGDMEIPGED